MSPTNAPAALGSTSALAAKRKWLSGARLAKIGLALSIFLIGGELLSRAYWAATKRTPLFTGQPGWESYYPQMRSSGALTDTIGNTDESYDVLILGGSTVSDDFGNIGPRLREGLERQLGRPTRVYNLALYGHNSRDSVLKHRYLSHQRFDLVVAYDGLNDARMNNAPPELFRDDYSHCRWYATLGFVERNPQLARSALLYSGKFALDRCGEESGLAWYIPRHRAGPDLTEHAREVKTAGPFRAHYEEIVTAATARGTRVVLMTFALHVPANYTEAACTEGQLDYANKRPDPVELWGKPEYVTAAVEQHNAVIRDLAAQHPVVLVDQHALLPRNGKVFSDCCHLTDEGCALFVANVLGALKVARE
jgi:hypothetical protein